jgi:DNA-binding GntR family transcriptional regulator
LARYIEIANDLRQKIAARKWKVGEYLPSIWELQQQYKVKGLNTIRDAQRILVNEGLLRPQQGVGVQVIALPTALEKESAADLLAEFERLVARLRRFLEPE